MAYIVAHQPKFTGAMACYDYHPLIQKEFKFITRFGDEVDASYREGNLLYVPREAVPLGAMDYRRAYPPVAINCNFKPRNEEQAVLPQRSLELLKAGQNHVFEAPTGWGKSVAGSVIAAWLGQPTAIVVNKTDLMDSWYDALTNALGIDPKLIGKVQQDTCDWKGKRIVLMMAHSICIPDRYPPEMYQYFGLLIVDEVHQIPTEFFGTVFKLFPAKYRLGFSATTDRKDGKWKFVEWNIGPILVRGKMVPMVPKILVKSTNWRIPRHKRWKDGELVEEPIYHAPGRMMLVNKAMAQNNERNLEIIQFAHAAYKKDRVTLLLSDLKEEHLNRLFQVATSQGIPGNHIGYYVGGMSKQQLEVTKKARLVLATYKMVDTGTNVPHWDSCVFCTPRSDIRQSLGRILRHVDGKSQPVALDLVDWDKIFQNFHLSRMKQYYALGAQIVKL
jgi:superfamily II DNA or RNA helicase